MLPILHGGTTPTIVSAMPWERGHSVDIGKPIQVTGNAIDHGQLTRAIDAVGTYIIIMWPPVTLNALLPNQDSDSPRG